MDIRLDKFLCEALGITRAEAKKLIAKQTVTVDSVRAKSGDVKLDGEKSRVALNGKTLTREKFVYIMLNKPAGYLSATEDGRGPTVLDLLPAELRRQNLFPVGRLDKDTEGLLLLTNDGDLAHHLLSPRHHVDKVYYTRVAGRLTEADCQTFASGMTLDDGLVCQPAGLKILRAGQESEAHVTLREGKFHQVKRMLAFLGKPVLYLERIQMGNLTLDPALARGEFRLLTESEEKMLRKI